MLGTAAQTPAGLGAGKVRDRTSCRWSQREFLEGLEHEPPSTREPRQGVCSALGIPQEQPLASDGGGAGRWQQGQFMGILQMPSSFAPRGDGQGVLGPSPGSQADSSLKGPGGLGRPSRPLPPASTFTGDVD